MIRESKPKLAKYAFEIEMSPNILKEGLLFGAFHAVLQEYPCGENEGDAWFQRYRNRMSTFTLTIYIDDEELYQRLKTTYDKVKPHVD